MKGDSVMLKYFNCFFLVAFTLCIVSYLLFEEGTTFEYIVILSLLAIIMNVVNGVKPKR